MAKAPQILTANRLRDGAVVYWQAGRWREALAEAEIFVEAQPAKSALEVAAVSVAAREVVNPYLFEARIEDGAAIPVKEREIIRAAGPSVRGDLGKQAGGLYAPPPVHGRVTHAEHTPGDAKDGFDASV